MRIVCLFFAAALLAACSDSDNLSWVIVSNPSGGGVGAKGGLVFTWRYSSKSLTVIGGSTDGGRPVALLLSEKGGPSGANPNETRDFYLGIDTDAVVVVHREGGEIHSPALSGGVQVVTGSMHVLPKPDSATALRVVTPTEVVHLAAAGNLVVVESVAGIVVMIPGETPRVFPVDSDLQAIGDDYLIIERSGRRTLIKPPPATPIGTQAVFDSGRSSYRFYSYANEFNAELPAVRFKVMDPSSGIRLDGTFPGAAGGALDTAFRAILPARNHHLLIVRTPD
jgi:hypothetical protein